MINLSQMIPWESNEGFHYCKPSDKWKYKIEQIPQSRKWGWVMVFWRPKELDYVVILQSHLFLYFFCWGFLKLKLFSTNTNRWLKENRVSCRSISILQVCLSAKSPLASRDWKKQGHALRCRKATVASGLVLLLRVEEAFYLKTIYSGLGYIVL